MANDIKLLDCTLRDGGYVNKWRFGNGNMICIYDRLTQAGVDIIEMGFLDDREPFDPERSIQPDTDSLSKTFAGIGPKSSMVVAMIDYGTCSLDNVKDCDDSFIDGIRVIFKKENMHKATDFGKALMDKGYKLFLQMVSITSYGDKDVKEFAEHVNTVKPYAVSVVDTYGLMHKEQLFHYFGLLDEYLDKGISIGYHSHNNFQLAYSNTIEMLKLDTDRDLVVDGTLYGMGKSAGNAPIELLAMHLNDNYGKKYDINQILEAIDTNIMPIYAKHYWGYSLFFYIAAKNDCHPNYVKYLMDKRTLSVRDTNTILGTIEPELKLKYTESHIEQLYLEYLVDCQDDIGSIDALEDSLKGKDLLIIGPGTSIITEKDAIAGYIRDRSPTVISVNFIPDIPHDYVFVSNPKRYSLMLPQLNAGNEKVIATSNVTSVGEPFEYTVRYDGLVTDTDEIWDNALVILLNLLKKIGVGSVTLAGFDGFKRNVEDNYVDSSFDLSKEYSYLSTVNRLLKRKIKAFSKDMDIRFLTESIYG